MRIRTKLRVATVAVGALIAVSAGLSLWSWQANDAAETARNHARQLEAITHELNLLTTAIVIGPVSHIHGHWSEHLAALRAGVDSPDALAGTDTRLLDAIDQRAAVMVQLFEEFETLPDSDDRQATQDTRRYLASRLLSECDAVMELAHDHLTAARARASSSMRSFVLALLALAGVATLAFVFITVMIGRGFLRPVLDLSRAVDRIGLGDLDTALASPLRNEIGDLARSIDATRIRLRRTLESERAITELLRNRDRELQRRAADLQRSNDDLAQFAYVASHDLRTPLRGIDNLAQWIAEDAGNALPEAAQGHLALLQERIRRMEQLLEDVLAYARAGQAAHPTERVATRQLADQVVELIAPPAGFTIAIAPDMPILRTAEPPLRQVLTNLVTNAIRHHDRPTGRVAIGAAPADGGWQFTVSDDGPGIPPEHLERVFAMFQTLKPKDQTGCTGMGLTLARRIAERQGGRVWIEPAAEGARGTTAHVFWPDARPAAAENAAGSAAA